MTTREGEEEAKTIFVYRSCDGCDFEVADEVVLESRLMKAHYIKDKKNEPEKKKHIYRIPGITADSMALVISCCKKFMVLKSSNTSYNDINRDLDIVTTFNLIQAAHFLNIQWLMNLSCDILLIKSRQSRKALMLFNYVLKDMQHSEDNSPLRIDILLRSRQKDTFINDSDFLEGHLSPFVLNQLRFVTRGKRIFKEHWRKIKESECYIDLLKSIRSFEELIRKGPRLAYHITATVFRCLIKILDKTRYNSDNMLDIQRLILSILSRARYDVCGDVIKQKLIPHLVQFVSDPENGLAIWAVIALTHIAYTFPDHIKEIVDEGALEAAYKALHNHLDVYWRMEQLASMGSKRGKGIPLIEVFNMVYLGHDKLKPSEQYGNVKLTSSVGVQYLYDIAEGGVDLTNPSIKHGDDLVVTVKGPTCYIPDEIFNLEFDLFASAYKDTVDILWPAQHLRDGTTVDLKERRMQSSDGTSEISVWLGLFPNAAVANLEVKLLDNFAGLDVYGVVVASNSELDQSNCASLLFAKKASGKIKLGTDGLIPLSKSCVAVPLNSSLSVDISLHVNGVHHKASLSLDAKHNGDSVAHYSSAKATFKVSVKWSAKTESVYSEYNYQYPRPSSMRVL